MKKVRLITIAIALGCLFLIGCGENNSDTKQETDAVSEEVVSEATTEVIATPQEPEIVYEELKLNTEIDGGFFKLNVDSFKLTKKLETIDADGMAEYYIIEDNKTCMILEGKLKNNGNSSKKPNIYIKAVVDEKEYTGFLYRASSGDFVHSDSMEPMEENTALIVVEIPDELADTYNQCDFYIGFDDNMEKATDEAIETKQYRYKYTDIVEGDRKISAYKMGETASSRVADITLNSYDFADLIDLDGGDNRFKPSDWGGMSASGGQIYFVFEINVKNNTDRTINPRDFYNMYVECDGKKYYGATLETDEAELISLGIGNIHIMEILSGETGSYRGYISLPSYMVDDTSLPIKMHFKFKNEEIVFNVR